MSIKEGYKHAILEQIKNGINTQKTIMHASGLSQQIVQKYINQLVRSGALFSVSTDDNFKQLYYFFSAKKDTARG